MTTPRRQFVTGSLLLMALAASPHASTAGLAPTARQSRGPFYPDRLPLERDNDLTSVTGRPEGAHGVTANVVGRVLGTDGAPIGNALVEIWQCDAFGKYHHPGDSRPVRGDPGFQGYGQFITASDGGYRFRTIEPVAYPGRAPHIHFAVRAKGRRELVTQMYMQGAPENERDFLLGSAGGPRGPLVVPFTSNPDDSAKRIARFDLVLSV